MRTNHTITGIASLQRVLWLSRGTRIALALHSFSIVQQENLEARFNRQLSKSGSDFCILGFIAALVGCILFDATQWPFFAVHPVTMLAGNIAVCLVAAVFGKTLGYLHARWQLARLIWAVAEHLEAIEENASPFPFPSAPRGELFAPRTRGIPRLSRAAIL